MLIGEGRDRARGMRGDANERRYERGMRGDARGG